MDPLITIGIPIYNVENYVEDCLRSVLTQTYKNLEILIVDDCGTDHSMDIINEILKKDNCHTNMRIIKQPNNMGLGNARNRIIREAKGEFIYFIDSDDCIIPTCITTLYHKMTENNYDFVVASYQEMNEDLSKVIKVISPETIEFSNNQDLMKYHFDKENLNHLVAGWNKLLRTSFIRDNKIEFLPNILYEDRFFIIELIFHAHSCAVLSDITYKYRLRQNSIMHPKSNSYHEKEINNMARSIQKEKEVLLEMKGNAIFNLIVSSYFNSYYYESRGYYRNNFNHINIKPYIQEITYYPLNLTQTIMLSKNCLKIIFYWFFSKLPYCMKCLIFKSY